MFSLVTKPRVSSPFFEFDKELTNLFDNFQGWGDVSEKFVSMSCDVKETDKTYELKLDVPGVAKKDIHLEVKSNTLTISTERKAEEKNENENFLRRELRYGKFTRSFTLPDGISESDITASFDNGVLNITIPKPKEKEAKKILIN